MCKKVSQSVSLGSSFVILEERSGKVRKGQERSGKVKKGQDRSGMVMEGHGRSYPNTRCVNNVRKVTGGGGWVACRIIVLSPGPGLCHSQSFSEIL